MPHNQVPSRISTRTLVGVVSRGVGLFFIVWGLTGLIGGLANTAMTWILLVRQAPDVAAERVMQLLLGATGSLFSLVAGCYLFFAGRRVINFVVRKLGNVCPVCDYDLRGSDGRCPECGTPTPASDSAAA